MPTQLHREQLIELILNSAKARSDRKIDFLFFIGADKRDERLFEYLKDITKEQALQKSPHFSSDLKMHLCIVGQKPSNADYFLDSQSTVAYVIQKLGFSNNSRMKSRSYSNLLGFNNITRLDQLTDETKVTKRGLTFATKPKKEAINHM